MRHAEKFMKKMPRTVVKTPFPANIYYRDNLTDGDIMSQFSKPWSELTLSDNFIFCKVMQDPGICRRMIEILLGIRVERIEYLETEKQIDVAYSARGIRLDVYVKDSSGKVFDIEMQAGNYTDMLLRARYYLGAGDVASVKHRSKFRELKESYILFICKDDPFGAGIPVYTKRMCFAETDAVQYDDKSHAVFYNCSAYKRMRDGELKDVLRFIYEHSSGPGFTCELETAVERAKRRPEWEVNYMYVEDIIEEEVELAREAAMAEGLEEGRHEAALEVARNLLALNVLTVEQIAGSTGLTTEQVKGLRK